MTNTTLPQMYCSALIDHAAHDFLRLNPWGYVRCPGRVLQHVHCPDITDHDAHTHYWVPAEQKRQLPEPPKQCPGRHTPDQLATNQPIARSADPLAGIPNTD